MSRYVEIPQTMFVTKCVDSENNIVVFVSRHGMYFSRVSSPIGLNAQLCCARFYLPLCRLTSANRNVAHSSTASVIRDMLCIKSRQAEIPGFSSNDVNFILECLYVS